MQLSATRSILWPVSVKLLSIKEIAQALGTHPETVRRWIRDGRLPAMKATKRTIRVRSDVVEQLLRNNSNQ